MTIKYEQILNDCHLLDSIDLTKKQFFDLVISAQATFNNVSEAPIISHFNIAPILNWLNSIEQSKGLSIRYISSAACIGNQ